MPKAITAMVIHKLDEQHALHLEDRVCDFIPEFEVLPLVDKLEGKPWELPR